MKPPSSFNDQDVFNDVCPELSGLKNNAKNSLGELNFISAIDQKFKNCSAKHLPVATFT